MLRHMALLRKSPDGSVLWDHCAVVEQRTGKWPEQYPLPSIPESGVDQWDWYWQLRNGASFGVNGPNPLAYSEIEIWSRLFRVSLSSKDLHILAVLDQQYLSSWYENQKMQNQNKKNN